VARVGWRLAAVRVVGGSWRVLAGAPIGHRGRCMVGVAEAGLLRRHIIVGCFGHANHTMCGRVEERARTPLRLNLRVVGGEEMPRWHNRR
jgi:hypothetical protein